MPRCTGRTCLLLASLVTIALHPTYAISRATHNRLELIHTQNTRVDIDNGIRLSLNSTLLQSGHSHQWFELSWRGVAHPSYADWVGLIVPAGADSSKTAPAKYQTAAMDPAHILHGEGKLK